MRSQRTTSTGRSGRWITAGRGGGLVRWRDHGGALEELPELGGEAGGRCPVHHVVVDRQGEIQHVPRRDLAVDDSRALAHPADDDLEGHKGQGRDAKASAAGEHAHSSHGDGTDALPGSDRSRHHGIHGRDHARDPGCGRSGSLQPPAAAAGRWVALDAAQLGGEVGHPADVSVAQEMGNGERPLRRGDLHHRAHIHVMVGHQLPSPVAVGMDLRVGGGGAGHTGHHEGGQRPGRIVADEEPVRLGYIRIDQPIHGHLSPPGAHGRGDQPPVGRKWPHLYPA